MTCPGECKFPMEDCGDHWYCRSWNCSTEKIEKKDYEMSTMRKLFNYLKKSLHFL